MHIPLANLRDRVGELDPGTPTVTYCNKGVSGNAGQNILLRLGFGTVYNLSGGNSNYQTHNAQSAKATEALACHRQTLDLDRAPAGSAGPHVSIAIDRPPRFVLGGVSGPAGSISVVTSKPSDFGSLADRTGAAINAKPERLLPTGVHVWVRAVGSEVPGLLAAWHQTADGWWGRVVTVIDGQSTETLVRADLLRKI
ncbi:MAG TPA: rhodanese-like domain-containing protein [Propionicimonas sp.]